MYLLKYWFRIIFNQNKLRTAAVSFIFCTVTCGGVFQVSGTTTPLPRPRAAAPPPPCSLCVEAPTATRSWTPTVRRTRRTSAALCHSGSSAPRPTARPAACHPAHWPSTTARACPAARCRARGTGVRVGRCPSHMKSQANYLFDRTDCDADWWTK